jgi:hypothetical protein
MEIPVRLHWTHMQTGMVREAAEVRTPVNRELTAMGQVEITWSKHILDSSD